MCQYERESWDVFKICDKNERKSRDMPRICEKTKVSPEKLNTIFRYAQNMCTYQI